MLHHLAIKVGDVTTATQMVWVVVELHLLVCIAFLEVTNLGNDTLTTNIDVLGIASALVGNEIRRHIE